jgi:hypothetical protein
MQKSGSEGDGRNHCRLSIFIVFISIFRIAALEAAGSEQNQSSRRQNESYNSAVDFRITAAH